MKSWTAKSIRAYLLFLSVTFFLLLVCFVASVLLGSVEIHPSWIWKILVNHISGREIYTPLWKPSAESIILNIRIPRVLLAFIAGAGLSLSGILMQALTKNHLADPYVLGISSGASAGAVLAIMTSMLSWIPRYRTMAGAFAGAVLAMVLAVNCASVRNKVTATQLVLSGIAVSALFSALTNMIIYCSPESSKQKTAFFWMVGSLSGASWSQVVGVGLICLIGFIVMCFLHSALDVLLLGDDTAVTLGMNTRVVKILIILICTLMTGAIVSVSGVIGFVGLVVPHITRLFVGSLHKRLIGAAVLIGGMFVVVCDMLSRLAAAPEELPIGVVTSCIGAPFFLWLLRNHAKRTGGLN